LPRFGGHPEGCPPNRGKLRAGVFVDHRGFFSQSNLCQRKTWTGSYWCNPEFIAKRDFGWNAFSGESPHGPVLVALQCRTDCNVKMEFPAAKDAADKIVAALELLERYLPRGKRILIRPHPRERTRFETGGIWRDDWQMDDSSSFSERLPACSALVTINSTCASEAALLGVPTATLGTGAFTGSGVTLECALDPSKLATLFSFQPDLHRCRAYCSAILGRHFLPYGIVILPRSTNFHFEDEKNWKLRESNERS